jgi:aspartate kinase
MKVLKFGGGCLKDSKDVEKIIGIIKKQNQAVVVVSALYKITDCLIEGMKKSIETEKTVPETVSAISKIHTELTESTINNAVIRQKTKADIEDKLAGLERRLYGIAYTGEISETTHAHVLSYGERLSAITLAGILIGNGIESIALEADRIGMITDDSFDKATALLNEAAGNLRKHILPPVNQGKIPVVTGYFGCTFEGKLTTFGRNGTDYSAAVVAHSIGAEVLEIWKDVDGFMSADPRIVKEAHRIDRLSYYEAAELSYFGAKILHPRTVEPLIQKGIPIVIKNLYEPETVGTEVSSAGYEREGVIKSVTCNRDISLLRIYGPGVGYKPGIIAALGRTMCDKGVNIYSVITSQTCINLLVAKNEARRSYESLKQFEGGVIDKIDKEEDIALIAVVGEGLLRTKGLAARVFSAVAEKKINVEMISAGASEVANYFLVRENDLTEAINAVHNEFFGESSISEIQKEIS